MTALYPGQPQWGGLGCHGSPGLHFSGLGCHVVAWLEGDGAVADACGVADT